MGCVRCVPSLYRKILPWFSFSSWIFLSLVTIFHSIFLFFCSLFIFLHLFTTIIFIKKKHIRNTHTKGWLTYQFSRQCVGERIIKIKLKWVEEMAGRGWDERRENDDENTEKKWNKFLLYNTFDRLYVVRIFML